MTDAIKTFIEAFYAAHDSKIDIPAYKDYDEILKSRYKPQKEETAEEIKNRIFGELDKLGKK